MAVFNTVKKFLSLGGNGKIDSQPFFFLQGRSSTKFCCLAEAKSLAWNLFELASYGKFGFSGPDLDENKLAKSNVQREKREIEKCLSNCTECCQFFCFEFLNLCRRRKG